MNLPLRKLPASTVAQLPGADLWFIIKPNGKPLVRASAFGGRAPNRLLLEVYESKADAERAVYVIHRRSVERMEESARAALETLEGLIDGPLKVKPRARAK